MTANKATYTVFEYESLKFAANDPILQSLQRFFKEKDFPYYSLVHNGVRFCEYVGVIQVGKTVIEILPKADRNKTDLGWREMLIGMLRSVGIFNIHAPSAANLTLKPNAILDLYFELFLQETEKIIHHGLAKSYHQVEKNSTALKGSLQFSKHIQQNLVHQERFFVKTSIYDHKHALNCVLLKTVKLLQHINTNSKLNSRIAALTLLFPELPNINVNAAWFEKLVYNRKTERYQKAIEIAKLLLLNYHPDLKTGRNDVLALLFDMNLLWEQFVFKSLQLHLKDCKVLAQTSKPFWNTVKMKPDILIQKDDENVVLDTKWKNIGDNNPSPEDLRQMYAYSRFHKDATTALVYPSSKNDIKQGVFKDNLGKKCSVIKLAVAESNDIKKWQIEIASYIIEKILSNKSDKTA
jgi:5-methylcytosine-specific restriction enzyme subunit McrC